MTDSFITKHSALNSRFSIQIGQISSQIIPVITIKNGWSQAVRYYRVWLHEDYFYSRSLRFFPAIAVPGSDFSSGRKPILLQGCLGARRFLQAKPGVNHHRPHFMKLVPKSSTMLRLENCFSCISCKNGLAFGNIPY